MDNRYFNHGCPALMQDGRFITNYIRGNVFDQFIRNVNDVKTAAEYRQFLQTDGNKILNRERAYLFKNNTCNINGKCLPLSGTGKFNVVPCNTCYNK